MNDKRKQTILEKLSMGKKVSLEGAEGLIRQLAAGLSQPTSEMTKAQLKALAKEYSTAYKGLRKSVKKETGYRLPSKGKIKRTIKKEITAGTFSRYPEFG